MCKIGKVTYTLHFHLFAYGVCSTDYLALKCRVLEVDNGKKSKRNYTFYGCGNYPECNFMTWDKPTDDLCPQCGKSLFKRKGGIVACLNEGCGFEKKAERKRKAKEE